MEDKQDCKNCSNADKENELENSFLAFCKKKGIIQYTFLALACDDFNKIG